ncbi:MAG: deoxyribodipyrimidine photo-lyase/cryptochrome family protein [Verrucomicrobiota bacterium]
MNATADRPVQVVWFKRDLRVADHAPLVEAAAVGPVLGWYLYEPELLRSPEWDPIHSRFIEESLRGLEAELATRGVRLITRLGEAVEELERLRREVGFLGLWSHEETGNRLTFDRDVRVGRWCRAQGVRWVEVRQDGVVRRLRDRNGWAERWNRTMGAPLVAAPGAILGARVPGLASAGLRGPRELGLGEGGGRGLQPGGEREAREVLAGFLAGRGVGYRTDMSSPVTAWAGCSRLSPYLAWGCVSLRTVHQAATARVESLRLERTSGVDVDGRWWGSLNSFQARLRWHCHFLQKLEDEPRIEFENFCRAYDGLREPFADTAEGQARLGAWREGRTGFPMVDACLRAVRATGWLNFRMRAMVMSFASYALWLPWRPTAIHLARCFLDFEPGIHFSQAQMQSGTTGINTLRIYSPAKQVVDHDPRGVFIRRWVPELAGVPDALLPAPERMSLDQQGQAGCVLGVDYPRPVVDFRRATAEAKERMYAVRRGAEARAEARQVYLRHGSRKGGRHRGAEADTRLREALGDGPDASAGPGQEWVQRELFG